MVLRDMWVPSLLVETRLGGDGWQSGAIDSWSGRLFCVEMANGVGFCSPCERL